MIDSIILNSLQSIHYLNLLQVSNQLNKLYMKFLKRNPGYSGKVCSSGLIHNFLSDYNCANN